MTHYIQDYIDMVKSGAVPVCREQLLLVAHVEKCFQTESIYVDEAQLERYMGQQKYFPYKLLEWETFIFALHNCTYKAPGALRWPIALIVVGRGAGKNGYLAFEDFCLITPINGIEKYNIDMFANSEDQARATFDDIYDILESDERYFSKYFSWNQEKITNKKTKSTIKYHTKAPNTKDGGRPGKVDFDELHQYVNSELLDVATTGLGKRPMPRRTYISTMGNVRDGPLDRFITKGLKVLEGTEPDGGWLYFICRLDSDAEIMQPEAWPKANPSLLDPTRQHLRDEIMLEFQEYKEDPAGHRAFATKRMNRPQGDQSTEVTSWENILAANQPYPTPPDGAAFNAVFGIDFADTRDFVAAGILWKDGDLWCWKVHTWICKQSPELPRIRFPYMEAVERGEAELVDEQLIPPDAPCDWVEQQAEIYNLKFGAIDHFRLAILRKALIERGWNPDPKKGNLKLTYRPEIMEVAPLITSAFISHKIRWGDSMTMRWYVNNACRVIDKNGNTIFEKIEPKTRKTDGFMAFVAAFIVAMKNEAIFEVLPDLSELPGPFFF